MRTIRHMMSMTKSDSVAYCIYKYASKPDTPTRPRATERFLACARKRLSARRMRQSKNGLPIQKKAVKFFRMQAAVKSNKTWN